MSAGKPEPLVIHGWPVFAHPLFLAQIDALARQTPNALTKAAMTPTGCFARCRKAGIRLMTGIVSWRRRRKNRLFVKVCGRQKWIGVRLIN